MLLFKDILLYIYAVMFMLCNIDCLFVCGLKECDVNHTRMGQE